MRSMSGLRRRALRWRRYEMRVWRACGGRSFAVESPTRMFHEERVIDSYQYAWYAWLVGTFRS